MEAYRVVICYGPHSLDNPPTDVGNVSLTRRPQLYSPETFFFCFWYLFLLEAEQTLEGLGTLEKNHSPHRVSNP
jgi:hypothetical protein